MPFTGDQYGRYVYMYVCMYIDVYEGMYAFVLYVLTYVEMYVWIDFSRNKFRNLVKGELTFIYSVDPFRRELCMEHCMW